MSASAVGEHSAILQEIYRRHYAQSSEFSTVTSGHWRYIGQQLVQPDGQNWKLEGRGFGYFRRDNLLNELRFAIEKKLNLNLLRDFNCSPEIKELALQVARSSQRLFDFDCAKQALALDHIVKKLALESCQSLRNLKTVCVIGDGYGFFSALLKSIAPQLQVVVVNLGRTLFFDAHYLSRMFPAAQFRLVQKHHELIHALDHKSDFILLPAEDFMELHALPIELFVNIASMQEMTQKVITGYFDIIKSSSASSKYFYCCNRVEKSLPDGELIKFAAYPWGEATILTDELCPWYQKFPIGYPPWWRPFDGPAQHRFVRY